MQSQTHVEQVGGFHYQAEYQHWDFIEDEGVSYLEATATKYIDRWEKKDGVKDLRKATSYIKKRLMRRAAGVDDSFRKFNVNPLAMLRWFESTNMPQEERTICTLILNWVTTSDLDEVIDRIESLIAKKEGQRG